MPVVPMVLGSALCMIVVSLLTAPPSAETIAKYFTDQKRESPNRGGQAERAPERVASRAR